MSEDSPLTTRDIEGAEVAVTERLNPNSLGLDRMTPAQMLAVFDTEDHAAVAAVAAAASAIARVAERVAEAYRTGGRVILLGAGTSGRIAVQEVAELSPTFGVEPDRFQALIASGVVIAGATIAAHEDDRAAVAAALESRSIGAGDVVIGIAASGTTPFVLAGLQRAKETGAWTVGIANSPCTPVLDRAHESILLATGPEVVAGSTRLKAGTAQKITLNRITTVAMVLCGRVRGNVMVEFTGSVDKLRSRAVRVVTHLGNVSVRTAEEALEASDWQVRSALDSLSTDHEPS